MWHKFCSDRKKKKENPTTRKYLQLLLRKANINLNVFFSSNLDACTTVHAAKLWKSLNAELKQCQNKEVQKGVIKI